jgi:hypothetical protein
MGQIEFDLYSAPHRVCDEELALVEALPAALVRALVLRLLAAVVLAHVLGQVLLPRRSAYELSWKVYFLETRLLITS